MPDTELLDAYWAMTEDVRDKLDEELWRIMPLHWPEQGLVDLDNLGDGSAWMQNNLGETLGQSLLDDEGNLSCILAETYLEEVKDQGYTLPSESDDEGKMETLDDLALVQADFRRFLAEWRKRAIPLIHRFIANGAQPEPNRARDKG